MAVVGIIVAFIIIMLIDLPLLLNCEQKSKTIFIYSVILLLGLLISIFQIFYNHTASPSDVIEAFIKLLIGD